MMQNLLVAAGCKGKTGYEIPFDQEFDEELPEATQDIAWIRSVPHNGSFPNLLEMFEQARDKGYEIRVIVMVRAWWITCRAQVINHVPASTEEAQEVMRDAYRWIFSQLEDVWYCLVSYDELVREPRALRALLDLLEFPAQEIAFEFRNENEKYYEADRSDTPL